MQIIRLLKVHPETESFNLLSYSFRKVLPLGDTYLVFVSLIRKKFHSQGVLTPKKRVWGTNRPNLFDEVSKGGGGVIVWCSISNRRIIGPYFFSEITISGETHRNMLSTYAITRIRILERRPIFMHDGGSPHVTAE